jgi:hypothetical protein
VFLSRSDRCELLAVVDPSLEILGLGDDGTELVFEATGRARAVECRHHVQLLFGDGGVADGHEEDGDAVSRDDLGTVGFGCSGLWWHLDDDEVEGR